MDFTSLERTVHHFLEAGLSESTRKVYQAGWNCYMSFVRAFSLPATPVALENVTVFVAFLGPEGLCVSTIESFLAALQHFQVLSDPSCILPSFHSLHMKVHLRGIRRGQAQQGPARMRLPITAFLLRRIKSHLSNDPSVFLNVLIWSACCVGFFGFLRYGEFLIPDGQQFDANRHLSLVDVTLDRSCTVAVLFVYFGIKDRPIPAGFPGSVLGATGSDLCPVASVLIRAEGARGLDCHRPDRYQFQ